MLTELSLRFGEQVSLVVGNKAYRGVLMVDESSLPVRWFIKLSNVEPGEPDEVVIHITESQ